MQEARARVFQQLKIICLLNPSGAWLVSSW